MIKKAMASKPKTTKQVLALVLVLSAAFVGLSVTQSLKPTVALAAPTATLSENGAEYCITADFAELPAGYEDETKPASIVVTDILDPALNPQTAAVQVYDKNNNDVTGNWTIAKNGQTITFTAKNTALVQNKHTFYINARLKAGATLKVKDGEFTIPNEATIKIDNKSFKTEEVEVKVDSAELAITKDVTFEHPVDDIALYTITVINTKEDSVAQDVVVHDTFVDSGFELVPDSLKVSGVPATVDRPIVQNHQATTKAETNTILKSTSGNAVNVTIPYLPYGATATITFEAHCTEAKNGTEQFNSVTATLSNPAPEKPDSVSAEESLWINSAKLNLTKQADQYEYRVGDTATYVLSLANTIPGTIAKNVHISDSAMNERVKVNKDSITVTGVPSPIKYNIDGNGTHQDENRDNVHTLNKTDNGFDLTIPYLPYGTLIIITYEAECTLDSNGLETMNTAAATCDNPLGEQVVEAKEGIWTNDALFAFDKAVEKYEYQVGETVTYTLSFMNIQAETIAKDIVVKDITLPDGHELDTESIAVEGVPKTVDYFIDSDGVGAATEQRENKYTVTPEGNSFNVLIDYLPHGIPVSITYNATPTEDMNGDEIINTATLSASNILDNEAYEDSACVWINTPRLSISKNVAEDKMQYTQGDVVTYTIQVDNEQVGTVARNIVIDDSFQVEGMQLVRSSLYAFDAEDNVLQVEKVSQKRNSSDFEIHTGHDLICDDGNYCIWEDKKETESDKFNPLGQDLQTRLFIEFQAVVTAKELNGKQVENIATAVANNAVKVEDSAIIEVYVDPSSPEPQNPPEPEPELQDPPNPEPEDPANPEPQDPVNPEPQDPPNPEPQDPSDEMKNDPSPAEHPTPEKSQPTPSNKVERTTSSRSTSTSGTAPTGKFYDKTGNALTQYWWIFVLVGLGCAGAIAYGTYAYRKSKRKDWL